MGIEIERKFLLASPAWRAEVTESIPIAQGYLADSGITVRVRHSGSRAWLTVKGKTSGISRAEYEYPIPVEDARQMLSDLVLTAPLTKTRHVVHRGGKEWTIDEFHGVNDGLIVAEIELSAEDEKVELPPWIGLEVSDDPRYSNAALSKTPYSQWETR